jgi:type I restriction enzyme, S subunit
MSFPRYPMYKDSGVEWLGEVPEHWDVLPLKTISSHNDEVMDESTAPSTEIIYVDISSVDAERGITIKEAMSFGEAPSRARRKVRHGDVIISTVRTYLRAIAAIYHPKENLVVSTGFAVIRPGATLVPEYLGFSLASAYFVEQVIARSTGVSYPAINASDLVAIPNCLPPLGEQGVIAAFLQRETEKIDGLITEQRRLIELLKEKRQAVVSHAVTRGLDPTAPMKPSGVEWLGDVPAHWSVGRVKTVSCLTTSGPRGWSDRVGEDGALFIQSGDLDDQLRVRFSDAKRVRVEDSSDAARTRLRAGDLVMCITGAKTGNVAACIEVPEDAYVNQHLCLIRPTPVADPMFLGQFLKGDIAQRYFSLAQYGLKQGLSLEDVREAPVVIPPRAEQNEIVEYISSRTAEFSALLSEAERAIALLHERRTALISAAVTGKIDVRGLAEAA